MRDVLPRFYAAYYSHLMNRGCLREALFQINIEMLSSVLEKIPGKKDGGKAILAGRYTRLTFMQMV